MNKAINQQSFTTLTRMLTSNVLTKRKSTSRKPLQGHAQKYWIHYEDNCDTINTTYKTCSMSEVLVSKLHTPATISCNSCFSSTTSWLCKPIVYHTSDFSDTPRPLEYLMIVFVVFSINPMHSRHNSKWRMESSLKAKLIWR